MHRLRIKRVFALCLGVGLLLAFTPIGVDTVKLGSLIDRAAAERSPHSHVVAGHTAVLPPAGPVQAVLVRNGVAVPTGTWVTARQTVLRITLRAPRDRAATLGADVEIQPLTRPLTGHVTTSSKLVHVKAGGVARVSIPLPTLLDGKQYHWQVRVRDVQKLSSHWAAGGRFGVSTRVPAVPRLARTSVRIGSWSGTHHVVFSWHVQTGGAPIRSFLYAVVPAGHTVAPAAKLWHRIGASQLSLPSLPDGRWQLLLRAVNAADVASPPAVWSFNLARQAPPAPRIVAAQPMPGTWSDIATPNLRWQGSKATAPLRAYEYQVVRTDHPQTTTPVWHNSSLPELSLPALSQGAWSVQVRELDVVGNVSPPLTWTFHIDRLPPALTVPATNVAIFTPPAQQLQLQFTLRQESLVTLTVYASGQSQPLHSVTLGWFAPGSAHSTQWDGRLDAGRLASPGNYTVVIHAVDRAGASAVATTQPVTVQDKWIRVSLSQEELWAYQGDTLVAQSPVTTGGPLTRTPPGTFHVLAKYTGWVFHSPWPPGSPLWYADSPTNFALLYEAADGYFIHDAPWRADYGPGTDSVSGTPGGNYTGTHGCTNVPYAIMAQLYNWASVGTLIQIVP